jgi:hypothetical protein
MSFQRKFNRSHKIKTMRTIKFAPEDKGNFEFIYTGFMVTPKELDKKGHRLHSRIQDSFESISHVNEAEIRVLNHDGGTVVLEESEFTLLKECLDVVKFLPKFSRQVNSMWDFLDSVKEEKLTKVV